MPSNSLEGGRLAAERVRREAVIRDTTEPVRKPARRRPPTDNSRSARSRRQLAKSPDPPTPSATALDQGRAIPSDYRSRWATTCPYSTSTGSRKRTGGAARAPTDTTRLVLTT